MSWIELVRSSATAACLAMAGLAGVASAETLVVRSTGPSMKAYPPGRAIPDSMKIVLKATDQVVILDGRGTRTLRGPGTFSPTMATDRPTDARATFADVSARRARPGAVRGMAIARGVAVKSPNIWFVDIGRSSIACVPDPARVSIWRPDSDKAGATVIRSADGRTATVEWAAGQSTQAWPDALPVTQGADYTVSGKGAGAPVTVKFAVLAPNPTTGLEGTAQALIKNGCTAQLDLLIETVAIPDVAKPAG